MDKTDSCIVKPCDGWAKRCLWKGMNSPATPTPGSGSSGAHVCGCKLARLCGTRDLGLPGESVRPGAAQGISKEGKQTGFQIPAQLCDIMQVTTPPQSLNFPLRGRDWYPASQRCMRTCLTALAMLASPRPLVRGMIVQVSTLLFPLPVTQGIFFLPLF